MKSKQQLLDSLSVNLAVLPQNPQWSNASPLSYGAMLRQANISVGKLHKRSKTNESTQRERGQHASYSRWIYIAHVCIPLDRALHFTIWQTCSFRHKLDFSGKHSRHAAATRVGFSFTFPPPSLARYSFMQLGHSMSNHQIFGHFSTDLLRFF